LVLYPNTALISFLRGNAGIVLKGARSYFWLFCRVIYDTTDSFFARASLDTMPQDC
jgi:hypothetical protein